jgi:hypothetical protein
MFGEGLHMAHDGSRLGVKLYGRIPPAGVNEPTDDELLRYLDGAMEAGERVAFEARLQTSPSAAARIEILADALAECGWPVADDEPDPE